MRVLTLDIETTPNLAYCWGIWQQDIGLPMLEETTEMLCFAAKWLGQPTKFFRGPDMVASAWELLNEADVVIHFNGKNFDVKHLNREFLAAGVPPPRPFKQIDLLEVVKKRFRFPSNKLQYVATALGLEGKADTGGFELWKGCMKDDPASWRTMRKYNMQDVVLTEKVYYALLPWIHNHPSLHLYDDDLVGVDSCPTCGSDNLTRQGFAYTKVSKFQQYRCSDCGSWFRDSRRIAGTSIQESVL